MKPKVRVELPPKLLPVFAPAPGMVTYRGSHGGRGSGKSFSFGKMSAIRGYVSPCRILCTREFQNSIVDSFYAEVKAAIESEPWLAAAYDIGVNYIKGKNGTEYIFKGLRNNIGSIKSLSGVDICIVEEAEDIPEYAWEALDPTIRKHGSEMWVVWNPKKKGSPVDSRFRNVSSDDIVIAELNWRDNPWFMETTLNKKRLRDKKIMSPEKYNWIWEGAYYELSDAQVFKDKYIIDSFDPNFRFDGPYCGLDFGFSVDPTVAIICWVYDNSLYIEHAAGKVGLDIDQTIPYFDRKLPSMADRRIVADSARPESISYLRRNGWGLIEGAKKGKGSVEDGVEHIKGFDKVIIHPRCEGVIHEFNSYSYKKDRLTDDILTQIIDKDNHYIDALRYALEPMMLNRHTCSWVDLAS